MAEGKKINHKQLINDMAGHLDHFNADTFQATRVLSTYSHIGINVHFKSSKKKLETYPTFTPF